MSLEHLPPRSRLHRPSRRRRVALRAMSVALGLVIAFGFAELCLRCGDISMPSLYEPDPFCGSRLRASTTGLWTFEGCGKVNVNSLGFRAPEFPLDKPPGVFRIAVFGDSFVEAFQVDDSDSLCNRLERLLNEATNQPSPRYQVINCGVSGYGTAQQLEMLRHHVLPLSPDAVLLAVFPGNDIRNNSRILEADPARPYFNIGADGNLTLDNSFLNAATYVCANTVYEQRKAYFVNRSRVLQVVKHVKQKGLNFDFQIAPNIEIEQALTASLDESIYIYKPSDNPEHAEAWKTTDLLLQAFSSLCQKTGIPVFAFTVSTPIQVYPDPNMRSRIATHFGIEDLFYSQRRLLNTFRETGCHFFPLASRMQEYADINDTFLHGFANTTMGIGHWNESGHSVAASLLAKWLQQEGLVRSWQPQGLTKPIPNGG